MKKNEKLFKSAATLAAIVAVTGATVIPSIVGVSANFSEDTEQTIVETQVDVTSETQEIVEPETQEIVEEIVEPEVQMDEAPEVEEYGIMGSVDMTTEVVAPKSVEEHTPSAQATQTGTVNVRYMDSYGKEIDSYSISGTVGDPLTVTADVRILGYTINNMYLPDGGSIDIYGNVTVHGTYTAATQTITFVYQEDPAVINVVLKNSTTGKTISDETYEGAIGSAMSKDYNAVIAEMKSKGYEVESSNYPTSGSPFVTNIDVDTYTIVMKHGVEVTTESREVTRTINSVNPKNGEVVDSTKQSHTFKRDKTRDKVTNVTTNGQWSDNNEFTFPAVQAKPIYGYTSSAQEVGALKVTADTKSSTETFTYSPKRIKAAVTFTDVTENKGLTVKNLEGDFDSVDPYNHNAAIEEYVAKGYELVDTNIPSNGVTYNKDEGVMNFFVELKHGIDVTTETKDVTRTVQLKDDDGEVFDTITQTVTFSREKTEDRVTKDATFTEWTTDKDSFDEIKVDQIVGYTTSALNIPAKAGVKIDDENEELTVNYVANEATAKVVFIDEVTGETIAEDNYKGKFGKTIDFTQSTLNGFLSKNYTVIDNPTTAATTYDVDGADKVITVKLGHAISKEVESHDVKMTVNFVGKDGKELGSDVQTITFERTTTTDLVTGEVVIGEWEQLDENFKDVVSPEFKGYKATVDVTKGESVTVTSDDTNVTVEYTVVEEDEIPADKPADVEKPADKEDNGSTPENKPADKTEVDSPKVDNKEKSANNDDPQTGVDTIKGAGVMAMAAAAMAGVLGFAGFKAKRKED